jgi:DNA-directed RNA polymerase specialized sigma subunit
LATWVSHKVRNIGEDIDRYKSETQIRGKRNRLVGKIIDATDSLSEEYGREPTVEELAAEIGAPEREITKTLAEWKADIDPISTEPNPFHGDVLTSHQQQMIRLVRHDLRQNERLIWDMYWGMNGQAKLTKQSQIARKAGVSDGTVTRTLQKITKKLQDEGIF